MTRIHRHKNADELARATAAFIQQRAQAAVAANGSFSIALAGGSTPEATYHRWAESLAASSLDPANLQFFWGDERCVPADDPKSNFRMAKQSLLADLAVPEDHIHPIRCAAEPEAGAAEYERELRRFFDGEQRRLDLVLLGLGSNSHTASLFPGSPLLAERKHWVGAEFVEEVGGWRATLTPPAINMARTVAFLVQGESKAEAVNNVIQGPHDPARWPAQIVEPADGELHWFVDEAAARLL